mmetsp:Transcript_40512/g.107400  ORF Transcript_40512/g.107400 Transcript_40512/m.107400 type:complete len:83 (+) Transcript_40512:1053-1301(+)
MSTVIKPRWKWMSHPKVQTGATKKTRRTRFITNSVKETQSCCPVFEEQQKRKPWGAEQQQAAPPIQKLHNIMMTRNDTAGKT